MESTKSKACAVSIDDDGQSVQGQADKKATWHEEDRWETADCQGH